MDIASAKDERDTLEHVLYMSGPPRVLDAIAPGLHSTGDFL